jgi:chromosome segregation ATPase
MYNRILNYLPDKEAELIKMSAELEKINIMTDCNNLDDSFDSESTDILNSVREIRKKDQENLKKQRETLKNMISRLNEENTDLRIQLEQIKGTSTSEQQKLNEYSSENTQLKRELINLKKLQIQEASKSVNEVQIKNELENIRLKLDFEINEKEQLKKKYDAELHATKIRCDNEILRQNQIMQEKYDGFVVEINKLSREIRELKDERNSLINLIEKEKNLNNDLLAKLGIKKS